MIGIPVGHCGIAPELSRVIHKTLYPDLLIVVIGAQPNRYDQKFRSWMMGCMLIPIPVIGKPLQKRIEEYGIRNYNDLKQKRDLILDHKGNFSRKQRENILKAYEIITSNE